MKWRPAKTRSMREFEERSGEPLETTLRRLFDEGLTKGEIANTLSISRTTLDFWLANLGAVTTVQFPSEQNEQPVG